MQKGEGSMEYILMQKSYPVVKITIDENSDKCKIDKITELYMPERVPLGISVRNGVVNKEELNEWWRGRAIPLSRDGIDNVLAELEIAIPQALLKKSLGLSLSDQYWICPVGSEYRWEKVNFFDNDFSADMGNLLFGNRSSAQLNLMSPDNTSDGWLKKKWKIINGKRCLVKGGSGQSLQEPYNEAIACALMRRLNIPHTEYSVFIEERKPYCVCDDFIDRDTELISAWYIMNTEKKPNHIPVYQHFLNCCEHLGICGASDFLDRMLTVDYIIANEDRHQNNFGVIRNADTLEFIGFAPIYDSGTSLWLDTPTVLIPDHNVKSKPFKPVHSEQIKLVKSFSWLDLSKLDGFTDECYDILKTANYIDEQRRSNICKGVAERIQMLIAEITNRKANYLDTASNDLKQDVSYSGNSEENEDLEL